MAMDIPLPSLLLNPGENGSGGGEGGGQERRERDGTGGGGGGEERGERSQHKPNLQIQTHDRNTNFNINEFHTKIDDLTSRNFVNVAPGKSNHI